MVFFRHIAGFLNTIRHQGDIPFHRVALPVGGAKMVVATRKRYINLGAAATASVVALGLVAASPERYGSMTARSEVSVVQLRA